MTQIKIIASFMILLISCKLPEFEQHIFIPNNYEGPIYIHYNVKKGNVRNIRTGKNSFSLFLLKNPIVSYSSDSESLPGYYEHHAYYYTDSSIVEINAEGFFKDLNKPFPYISSGGGCGKDCSYFYVMRDSSTYLKLDSLKEIASKLHTKKLDPN